MSTAHVHLPSCHSQAEAGPVDASCLEAYAASAWPSSPAVAVCAGPPAAAAARAASQEHRWSKRCSGTSGDASTAHEKQHTCKGGAEAVMQRCPSADAVRPLQAQLWCSCQLRFTVDMHTNIMGLTAALYVQKTMTSGYQALVVCVSDEAGSLRFCQLSKTHMVMPVFSLFILRMRHTRQDRPWVLAASIATAQDVLPELLSNCTAAAVVALPIWVLALGTVTKEQQPALLLQDELVLLLALFGNVGWVLLVAPGGGAISGGVDGILPLGPGSSWQAGGRQLRQLRNDIATSDGGTGCAVGTCTGHAAAIAHAHVVHRHHAIACRSPVSTQKASI